MVPLKALSYKYVSIFLLLCGGDRLQMAAVDPAEAGDGGDEGVLMLLL